MSGAIWRIRGRFENFDPHEAYEGLPSMISMKINHGGFFTKTPGRKYVKGKTTFVDLVDSDHLSVLEINDMIQEIGYTKKHPMWYHFKIPDSDLDNGLQDLGTDQDIINLLKHIDTHKTIEVFIEHLITTVIPSYKSPGGSNVVIEELPSQVSPQLRKSKKQVSNPGRLSCKKQLLLEYIDVGGQASETIDVVENQLGVGVE